MYFQGGEDDEKELERKMTVRVIEPDRKGKQNAFEGSKMKRERKLKRKKEKLKREREKSIHSNGR